MEEKRYMRVFDYYKKAICDGALDVGTRLPSIRGGAEQFGMSRTTIEAAYLLLAAEGYIISKPQSGYYVTDMAMKLKDQKKLGGQREKTVVRYDFATVRAAKESFHFELWRRYMKSALRQDDRLSFYGDPQGETEFREVLTEYLRKRRQVVCEPDQIVIGAGIQTLLHILCPMIRDLGNVCLFDPKFIQAKAVFEDHGIHLTQSPWDKGCGSYYLTPSQMEDYRIMPVKERSELLAKAREKGVLLIEDDYDQEFRYLHRPVASLQGLSQGNGVVYLGTFSKMLLPSIRMSFMVLPRELQEAYMKRREAYNQTASKAEQIAITQYIRDGHLDSQIRKTRKEISQRMEYLFAEAKDIFGAEMTVECGDSGTHILLKTEKPVAEAERLKMHGIRVIPSESGILLSCMGTDPEHYREALQAVREVLGA